jgi:hypothetical protein
MNKRHLNKNILKNKKAYQSWILISTILALFILGIISYSYFKNSTFFFESLEDFSDITSFCESYCNSNQYDNYCHYTFNLKTNLEQNNEVILKDITCNFLSKLQNNNPVKIKECKNIQCKDLIIKNNQDQYTRQSFCDQEIKRVYSLNDLNPKIYTLYYSLCVNEDSLICSDNLNLGWIKIDIDSLENSRKNVLKTMGFCLNSLSLGEDCWQAVNAIYYKAGVSFSCVYSDPINKKYEKVSSIKTSLDLPFLVSSDKNSCTFYNLNENEKLNLLQSGDIISYIWDKNTGHNAIFVEWVNKNNKIAKLFDWNGQNKNYRYYEENLSDFKHPVYMIWKPIEKQNTN